MNKTDLFPFQENFRKTLFMKYGGTWRKVSEAYIDGILLPDEETTFEETFMSPSLLLCIAATRLARIKI